MSRLIIKNLPAYVTPARLKEYFSQKDGPGGTLTDAQVALKPDGTSRRFGFVGFKTDTEAKKAQEWFDRTYIDTTRIGVQIVEQGARDAPAPRPNKRPRVDPSSDGGPSKASSTKKPKDAPVVQDTADNAKAKGKSVAHLDDFLQVMQSRTKKGRSWANEDTVPNPSVSLDPSSSSRKDELQTEAKLKKAKSTDTELDTAAEVIQDVPMEEGQEELDDLQWMKRRMTKGLEAPDNSAKAFEQDDEDDKAPDKDAVQATEDEVQGQDEERDEAKETILQTSRLFLRNLAFSCTESELNELFSPYGDIAQIHISLDPLTKSSKGLGFITFAKPACALEAYEALDKTSFQGRLIHILPAVDRKGANAAEGNEKAKLTVRGDKDKKRKESSGRDFNWSMLYMNSDAVASSIADRMNVPKADILNPQSADGDSTSAAVKLALAETHIIQETRSFLEAEGIDLSAFAPMASTAPAGRLRRSDTCILVKNIPYGTTVAQIRELFELHGELARVLVPPAGTIAVVDFIHPDEASKAFRAVAYRRMGSSIVYLEKAPLGIFTVSEDSERLSGTKSKGAAIKPVTVPEQKEETLEDDNVTAAGSTLFVKNLSFATTPERLTQVFRHLPSFVFARVQTKPDPKAPGGGRLSMGYGFVGFKTRDAAKKAMLSMQGFVLDGHALHVKFAGRGAEEEEGKGKEKVTGTTTKMLVKNVPFEVTKKDIRELFGVHGQLKSVRLPKKFDSQSRGFAFLDFVSRHEAENAFTALRHTHLLGRHLVLEWAEDTGQDVDLLRMKAGVGYGGGAEVPGRKRKLNLGEDSDDMPDNGV